MGEQKRLDRPELRESKEKNKVITRTVKAGLLICCVVFGGGIIWCLVIIAKLLMGGY